MRKTKTLITILLAILTFAADAQSTAKVYYTCVMHPEIKAAKPGNCPKCGIALVKKTSSPVKVLPKKVAEPAQPSGAGNHPAQKPAEDDDKPTYKATPQPQQSATTPAATHTITAGSPKKVRYDLYVADTVVNYTGRWRKAIAKGRKGVYSKSDVAGVSAERLKAFFTDLKSFSGSIQESSMKAPASGWPLLSGSWSSMMALLSPPAKWAKAPPSISTFRQDKPAARQPVR